MKRGNGDRENRGDRKQNTSSKTEVKGRLLAILTRHIGIEKAIGMGELYEGVYGKTWQHRINDTRDLRYIITELRWAGVLVGETRSKQGGGYYLARSSHELQMFFDRRTHEAVKKLGMIAKMKQIGLPEFLGQMQLNLRNGETPRPPCESQGEAGRANGGNGE